MARKKSRLGLGLLNYRARITLWSVILIAGVFGYFWYSAPQHSVELTGMFAAEEEWGCHQDALGGWGYCSSGCPCYAGEGDCDSDADCVPGTACVSNAGEAYGYEPRVDVCMIVD
jgi:hypothetical protein